jgi:NAD(P)-dependent dehydrogenase (short-subunit alcohol dehydrogenase family)
VKVPKSRALSSKQIQLIVYTATKSAADAITIVLSKELGPKKIRVNAMNPGMVETEGVHAAGFIGSDFQKWAESQTPLGRFSQVWTSRLLLSSSLQKIRAG